MRYNEAKKAKVLTAQERVAREVASIFEDSRLWREVVFQAVLRSLKAHNMREAG